jgi:hypothetical protein
MRIIFVLPVLLLGACQVSKDNANNTVSVTMNEEVAANAAKDVGNTVENVATAVGNDVKTEGARVENKVDADKTKNSTTTTTTTTNTTTKKH